MLELLEPYLGPEGLVIAGAVAAAVAAYLRGNMSGVLDQVRVLESLGRAYISDNTSIDLPENIEATSDDIEAAVREEFGDSAADSIMFLDGRYYAPEEDGFDTMRRYDITEFLPYRPARFDCENFAQMFQVLSAFAFGVNSVAVVIDWSGGHAYNLVYLADGSLRLYEPQTDEVVELGDSLSDTENYTMDNVDIIF